MLRVFGATVLAAGLATSGCGNDADLSLSPPAEVTAIATVTPVDVGDELRVP